MKFMVEDFTDTDGLERAIAVACCAISAATITVRDAGDRQVLAENDCVRLAFPFKIHESERSWSEMKRDLILVLKGCLKELEP